MKNYVYKGEILTEDMKLSADWWNFFLKKWERTPNSPSLQCISNLCGNIVGPSQCGVVLRRGYSASFDTSIPIIEVASAVGYITLDQRKFLYNYMKSVTTKSSSKKKISQKAFNRIMHMAS
jgi:hypothetical protein